MWDGEAMVFYFFYFLSGGRDSVGGEMLWSVQPSDP